HTTAVAAPSGGLWSLSSLQQQLAHLTDVPLKYAHWQSNSWAKLEEKGTKAMKDILTELQQLREQEKREEANLQENASAASTPPSPPPSYYVHDYSLPLSAPSLLSSSSSLHLPRYFSCDLLQSLRPGSYLRE